MKKKKPEFFSDGEDEYYQFIEKFIKSPLKKDDKRIGEMFYVKKCNKNGTRYIIKKIK